MVRPFHHSDRGHNFYTTNPQTGSTMRKGGNPDIAKYGWKKGQSGNPKGHVTAGNSIRTEINYLVQGKTTEKDLHRIVKDPDERIAKQVAALQVLRALESPDLADFQALVGKGATLDGLRRKGIDTTKIKKLKTKTKIDNDGTEVVEAEIELHDRAGESFDRIVNQTAGAPKQTLEVDATVASRIDEATVDQANWLARRFAEVGKGSNGNGKH